MGINGLKIFQFNSGFRFLIEVMICGLGNYAFYF